MTAGIAAGSRHWSLAPRFLTESLVSCANGAPVAAVYDCRELEGNPSAHRDAATETRAAARQPTPKNDFAVHDFAIQKNFHSTRFFIESLADFDTNPSRCFALQVLKNLSNPLWVCLRG